MADSVGCNLSTSEVEKQQKCRIKKAHAYSSLNSEKQNFTNIVNHHLKNPGEENFEVLVMSAPTADITNLDVNVNKTANNYHKLEKAAKLSSQNIFTLAERSLYDNHSLKKVIIMEHPPRFDLPEVDPHAVRPNLAKLANIALGQLWLNSSLKDKIVIGRHNLETPGVGPKHYQRYQSRYTGRYDGVHLYGQTGYKDYTNSVKSILSLALPSPSPSMVEAEFGRVKFDRKMKADYHQTCPQALYQRGKFHPSVEIRNRFDVLSQGNW